MLLLAAIVFGVRWSIRDARRRGRNAVLVTLICFSPQGSVRLADLSAADSDDYATYCTSPEGRSRLSSSAQASAFIVAKRRLSRPAQIQKRVDSASFVLSGRTRTKIFG